MSYMNDNKEKRCAHAMMLLQIVLIFVGVAAAIILIMKFVPQIVTMVKDGNVEGIEDYIKNLGGKGVIALIFVQIVETVAIVLPALPVYICAGAIYGKILGILMCYITNVIVTMGMYIFAHKMKVKTLQLPGGKGNPKIDEWFKRTRHPQKIVFALCLIPIIPNGMIPFVASNAGVGPRDFFKSLVIGCLPAIAIFVCCGDIFISDIRKMIALIIVLIVLFITGGIALRKLPDGRVKALIYKWLS